MSEKIAWVVVEVQSGIPVTVAAFSTFETAKEYSESLRERLNMEDDEVGFFKLL